MWLKKGDKRRLWCVCLGAALEILGRIATRSSAAGFFDKYVSPAQEFKSYLQLAVRRVALMFPNWALSCQLSSQMSIR